MMKNIHGKFLSIALISLFLYSVIITPNLNNGSLSAIRQTIPSKSENTTPSSASMPSTMASLNNINMAEGVARYLNSQYTNNGNGIAWANGSIFNDTYGQGIAGIGTFYLNLYENTHNTTYLTYANQIGIDLNSEQATLPAGSWPTYNGESNAQNYTGIMQGSAGVGEFLIQLAKDSGNTTYGLLAQNIANRLILIAKPSPLNTGIRIRSQDVVSMTGPNTIPTTAASATNISSSMIYGTGPTGVWGTLGTGSGSVQFTGNSSNTLNATYNVFNNTFVQLSNASNPSRDGESLYQTFNAPFYPFFIDPISGIRLLLYTSNNMGNGSLTMSIYQASSLGTPNGAQIGSTSNSWNATFHPHQHIRNLGEFQLDFSC